MEATEGEKPRTYYPTIPATPRYPIMSIQPDRYKTPPPFTQEDQDAANTLLQLQNHSYTTIKNLLFRTFKGDVISFADTLSEKIKEQRRLDWPRMTEQEIREQKARDVAKEREDRRQAAFGLVILSGKQRRADLKAAGVLMQLRRESDKVLRAEVARLVGLRDAMLAKIEKYKADEVKKIVEQRKVAAAEKAKKEAEALSMAEGTVKDTIKGNGRPRKKAKIVELEPECEEEPPASKRTRAEAKRSVKFLDLDDEEDEDEDGPETAEKQTTVLDREWKPKSRGKAPPRQPTMPMSQANITEPEPEIPGPAPKRELPARSRGRPRKYGTE